MMPKAWRVLYSEIGVLNSESCRSKAETTAFERGKRDFLKAAISAFESGGIRLP